MHGEGCPAKSDAGKLGYHAAVRYLLGYKYKGGDQVWIPKLGVQETRDVVFYEGKAPMMPVDSRIIESVRGKSKLHMSMVQLPPAASTCCLACST